MKKNKKLLLLSIIFLSFCLVCFGSFAYLFDNGITEKIINIGELNFEINSSLNQKDIDGTTIRNYVLKPGMNDPNSTENTPDMELMFSYKNRGNISILTKTLINISGTDKEGNALSQEQLKEILIGVNSNPSNLGDTTAQKSSISILVPIENTDNTLTYVIDKTINENNNILSGFTETNEIVELEYDENNNAYPTENNFVLEIGLLSDTSITNDANIYIKVDFQAIKYRNTNDSDFKTVHTQTYEITTSCFPNITLKYDNGNDDEIIQTNTITDLPTPQKEGYSFDGWYIYDENNDEYEPCPDNFDEDLTLIALWSPNSYTYNINYVSESGKVLGNDTVSHLYDTTNTISPPDFTGYETPQSQTIVWNSTEPQTITFTYKLIEYTINFHVTY